MVLRHILLGDGAINHAFACERVIASELLEIECRRVLHRYRLNGDLDDEGFVEATRRLDEVLAGITVLGMTSAVKRRAMGAFPVVVKTLDALHLSSALEYEAMHANPAQNERVVVFFSNDAAMNRCAAAVGMPAPMRQE